MYRYSSFLSVWVPFSSSSSSSSSSHLSVCSCVGRGEFWFPSPVINDGSVAIALLLPFFPLIAEAWPDCLCAVRRKQLIHACALSLPLCISPTHSQKHTDRSVQSCKANTPAQTDGQGDRRTDTQTHTGVNTGHQTQARGQAALSEGKCKDSNLYRHTHTHTHTHLHTVYTV